MSYLYGDDQTTLSNGLGCGPTCGCGPCRTRTLGEWYIKDDEDDSTPPPVPAKPPAQPAHGNVGGYLAEPPDARYYGYYVTDRFGRRL